MQIRWAQPEDVKELLEMNRAFNEVEDVTEESVLQCLETGKEKVAVVQVEDALAGFCCAQIHPSFCYSKPSVEITELYVKKEHRNKGCAKEMLRFMTAYAMEEIHASEIHLMTGLNNEMAKALYRKMGFEEKQRMYFEKHDM